MTGRMSPDAAVRTSQAGSIATNQATRKPIDLPHRPTDLAELFLTALYWGVDESVTASRGGWPR